MMHAAPATDLPATAGPAGVSIIIPAYNYARYLPGAIDSALAQTHPHKEVIVVDDGSTDDTPEVIAHYGERVRGIRQANAGLSAARNTGIQAAQYPYVAFLDADDLLGPAFLAELMESFQKLPEDYGLVACDCLKFRGDGEIIPQKKLKPETAREITTAQLVLRNQFVADAVVAGGPVRCFTAQHRGPRSLDSRQPALPSPLPARGAGEGPHPWRQHEHARGADAGKHQPCAGQGACGG
jgi:hypothetical protein